MKRYNFEKQFGQYGVKMSEYGGACYFGENDLCSLALGPFPADEIRRAKLAIRTESSAERKVVVNTFLHAAGVEKNPEIADALEGREYRGRNGMKNVTIAVLDDEFVVTVTE